MRAYVVDIRLREAMPSSTRLPLHRSWTAWWCFLGLLWLMLGTSLHASEADSVHDACSPVVEPTANLYRFNADLDGVDGLETYVADRTGGTTLIHSCDDNTMGPWDWGDANKPLNRIIVLDVEGDGVDELVIGGPTGSSPLTGNIVRLVDKELQRTQYVRIAPETEFTPGSTVACIDIDTDGMRELVNFDYSFSDDGETLLWNGNDGSTGTFQLPEQATRAWAFRSGQCGDRILLDTDFRMAGYPAVWLPENLQRYLKPDSSVALGINNEVLIERKAEELAFDENWILQVEHFAAYQGPFPVLKFMQRAQIWFVGEHNHCVGAPLNPPVFAAPDLIQLSARPYSTDGCLQWFAVDLWVREDFTLVGVMLNIWEP